MRTLEEIWRRSARPRNLTIFFKYMYQQDQLKSYFHRYYRSCQNRNFMKKLEPEQEKIVRLHNTVTVPDNVQELKCKC